MTIERKVRVVVLVAVAVAVCESSSPLVEGKMEVVMVITDGLEYIGNGDCTGVEPA